MQTARQIECSARKIQAAANKLASLIAASYHTADDPALRGSVVRVYESSQLSMSVPTSGDEQVAIGTGNRVDSVREQAKLALLSLEKAEAPQVSRRRSWSGASVVQGLKEVECSPRLSSPIRPLSGVYGSVFLQHWMKSGV